MATSTLATLNDRYAEKIIGDKSHDYDALEVHGVRNLNAADDPEGTCCEIDEENPEFFSTYAHLKAGGIECVGDFAMETDATAYAVELAEKYGWLFGKSVVEASQPLAA